MSRQQYAGVREPWPRVSTHVNFQGQKRELQPQSHHRLGNANTFTNLDNTFKDNIDSIAVPAHMRVQFDTWYKNNKNELTPIFDGHKMGFYSRTDHGVSAVNHDAREACNRGNCVKSADSYGVQRVLPWKNFVIRCCSGAGGGIVDSTSCGEYWNGKNKDLCDPVMQEWCKPDPNEKFRFGEAKPGAIYGRIYNENFDEATAQKLCNASWACTGITETQDFYFELRASSEVHVNPNWNEYTMLKKDTGQSQAIMYGSHIVGGYHSVIAKVFNVKRREDWNTNRGLNGYRTWGGRQERIAAFWDGTHVKMVRMEGNGESNGRSQDNYGWYFTGKTHGEFSDQSVSVYWDEAQGPTAYNGMYIPDGNITELSAIMYGDDMDTEPYVRVFQIEHQGKQILLAAYYDGTHIKMAPVFPENAAYRRHNHGWKFKTTNGNLTTQTVTHAWNKSSGPHKYNALLQNYRAPQKGYSGGFPANVTYKSYNNLTEAIRACSNNPQCKAVTARARQKDPKWKLGRESSIAIPLDPPNPYARSKMLTNRSTDYDLPIDKEAKCACKRSAVWDLDKIRGHPECIDYKCMKPEAYKFGKDRQSCNINIVDCSQQVQLNDVEKAQLQDIKLAADCKMEVAPDPSPEPEYKSDKTYKGAFGGYDFDTVEKAKARCQQEGLQLCGKEDVIAGAKQNTSLENVCSTGWTTSGDVGWYSVKARDGCGGNNQWNTWRPENGKASAHCCSSHSDATDATDATDAATKVADTIKEKVGGNVAVIGAAVGAVALIIFVFIVIIAIRKRRNANQ